MNIGIIGHEAAKFDANQAVYTQALISGLIGKGDTVVSGHCHLGGVDIWAEESADRYGLPKLIFPPKTLKWEGGYKQRNIQIAEASDKIYVIVVRELPPNYKGMRFNGCYHCDRPNRKPRGVARNDKDNHVKSGACWTAWYAAEKLGKEAEWIVI